MNPVDRRHRLTSAELLDRYLLDGWPVVVEGVVETWPAWQKWSSPAALLERVGNVSVPFTRAPASAGTERAGGEGERYSVLPALEAQLTPFDECLRQIFGSESGHHYLREVDLLAFAPQLAQDFFFPYPELDGVCDQALFWIGSKGCVSRLHFDLAHNFACVVSGKKRFRLFSPQQSHRLYPALDGKFSPISTLGDVPLEGYPLFAGARSVEVCLEAGDLLFLPSFWWHQVLTDEPGVMLTWFWNAPAMARDRERMVRYAEEHGAAALLSPEGIAGFETAAYRDLLRANAVRLLLEHGRPSAAREQLSQISDPSFACELAELLEGAACFASGTELDPPETDRRPAP